MVRRPEMDQLVDRHIVRDASRQQDGLPGEVHASGLATRRPTIVEVPHFDPIWLGPGFDEMVAAADRFVGAHPNALKKLGE